MVFLSAWALGVSLGPTYFSLEGAVEEARIKPVRLSEKNRIHPSVAFSDRYAIVSTPDKVNSRNGHMTAELGRWADWGDMLLLDATMAKCLQYHSVPIC